MPQNSFNMMNMLDPESAQMQQEADARLKMAQMLRAQSLQPMGANNQFAVSPFEGIAKLAQALAANKMEGEAQGQKSEASKAMAEALAKGFGFDGAASQPMSSGAGQAQPTQRPGSPSNEQMRFLALSNPQEYSRMMIRNQEASYGSPQEDASGRVYQVDKGGNIKFVDGVTTPKNLQAIQLGDRVGVFDPRAGFQAGADIRKGVSPDTSATLPIMQQNADTSRMSAVTQRDKYNADQKTEAIDSAIPPDANTPEGFNRVVDKLISADIELPKNPRSPFWLAAMQAAVKKEPTFNQADYAMRRKTKLAFAPDGVAGKELGALNTVAGHLSHMNDLVDKLNNFDTPKLNEYWNAAATAMGGTAATTYESTIPAVASEMMKSYRGAGGSQAEVEAFEKSLQTNMGKPQQKEVLKNFGYLLQSKINSLANQYNRGMGTSKAPLDFISPESQASFKKLMSYGEAPKQRHFDAMGNEIK